MKGRRQEIDSFENLLQVNIQNYNMFSRFVDKTDEQLKIRIIWVSVFFSFFGGQGGKSGREETNFALLKSSSLSEKNIILACMH